MSERLPLAKRIIGYCDPLSAAPGEEVRFFVSCEPDLTEFAADLVRLRAGSPGWEDTGPDCTLVPCSFEGRYQARHQQVHPGSYALIPGAAQACGSGLVTMLILVQPTYASGGSQALVSCADPWAGSGFALILDHQLRPALVSATNPDQPVTSPAPFQIGVWGAIVVTLGGTSAPVLAAGPLDSDSASWPRVTGKSPQGGMLANADDGGLDQDRDGSIVLGAIRSARTGISRMHFTGRMESPTVLPGAADPAVALRLTTADPPSLQAADVIAAWDFSIGIGTWTVTDRGPRALHGTLHNLPMRAVRGARWSSAANDWRDAPGDYAALHFLADALEDCDWISDFTLRVPDDARSGFYAARVTSGEHQDFIPFFIRPKPATTAKMLLVAPTATYAAYGNSRFWWENTLQEMVQDRLIEIGPEEQYLITHAELGSSSYDCHLDGTDVCYVSRRRPNLNMRPGHVRREGYTCDLYLVAWLDRLGHEYDVATDEDLHHDGRSLLDRYQVVLTGTHPEYMSARMFDAFADWADAGGRLMYMGGNGFWMNVNFDADRPWIMENRRVDLWKRDEDVRRSESLNSTDGMRGGRLSAIGRQSAYLTGVASATMGFDHSYPYVLGSDASRPEAAFVFEGVTGSVIGDFGGLGGGVVGQEWDNAAGYQFGPEHLILASSHDHTLVPPMFGAVRPDYHGDLVLYLRGEGAVFSVSSMAWCGALSHQDYDNEIELISHNVLRRFLDPAPFTTPGEGADA
jgi:N,N-dimethylformamidase